MPNKKKNDPPPKQVTLFSMQQYEDEEAAAKKLLLQILALETVKGVGFRTICALIDKGYIETIWQAGLGEIESMLSDMPVKNKEEVAKAVFEKKEDLFDQAQKKADWIAQKGIVFVPYKHPRYPAALKRLTPPPRWIFVRGNLQALHSSGVVGIIGTREASSEGKRWAYSCAREMVIRNIIVLSGLAKGIDEQAHQAAVDYYGQTIGILGHGLFPSFVSSNDYLWDRIIERDGVIISEYLLKDAAAKENFLRRNELQASLSKVIIPIECPSLASGTGATIRRAMNLGTPVVGIYPDQMQEIFESTKSNLKNLTIPVFSTPSMASNFWAFLRAKLPEHEWNADATARQDRMIHLLQGDLIEEMRRSSFDDRAIERFAEAIKKKLHEIHKNEER